MNDIEIRDIFDDPPAGNGLSPSPRGRGRSSSSYDGGSISSSYSIAATPWSKWEVEGFQQLAWRRMKNARMKNAGKEVK